VSGLGEAARRDGPDEYDPAWNGRHGTGPHAVASTHLVP
jgi:hypothetical protein